jgi:hypothetical protein
VQVPILRWIIHCKVTYTCYGTRCEGVQTENLEALIQEHRSRVISQYIKCLRLGYTFNTERVWIVPSKKEVLLIFAHDHVHELN